MATLPTKEKRPTGITIFAILFGIGTAISVALIFTFSSLPFVSDIPSSYLPFTGALTIIFGISAALNGIMMYGLLSGSKVLRMLIMIIAIINAITDLFYFNVIGFIINIIVLWYLTQPHVKKYFGLEPTPSY